MRDKSFAHYWLAASLARTRASIYNYNENSRASESGSVFHRARLSPSEVLERVEMA